jgi:type II secretory ATPase GspE/PulE/Tfp pilus assembly ATPase PilB-like protein
VAVYRQIHTCFWEDDKVLDEMSLEEKFFYLYLLTNQKVKQCGCYDISWKKFILETTLPKQEIESMLEKFEKEYNIIKYNKETKEILLLNFYKYNWTSSPKVRSCIESELKNIKEPSFIEYIKNMIGYKYGINTVCIDLGEEKEEEEEEKNKNKNKNKKKNKEEDADASTTPIFDFQSILDYGLEKGADEIYCKKFYEYYKKKNLENWKLKFDEWIKKDGIEKNIYELKKVSDGVFKL